MKMKLNYIVLYCIVSFVLSVLCYGIADIMSAFWENISLPNSIENILSGLDVLSHFQDSHSFLTAWKLEKNV